MFQPRNHLIGFLAALLAVVSHRAGSSAHQTASQSPIRCALMSAFSCELLDCWSRIYVGGRLNVRVARVARVVSIVFCHYCNVVDLHLL